MRQDRLARVEHFILQSGSVSLVTLAEKFQLSVNTIRRDVIELERRGLITRTHGGAIAKERPKSFEEIGSRHQKNAAAKQLIGYLAAKLVQDGQTIFIDAGSTTKTLIPYLRNKQNITIITNSVNVLMEASKLPNVTLLVLGGEYSATSDCLYNYASIEELKTYNIDISFMGTTGLSVSGGLTTATFMEAKFKKIAMQQGKTCVVMADASKMDIHTTSKFAELAEVSSIVTDQYCPEQITQYAKSSGIDIILPSPEEYDSFLKDMDSIL